MVRMIAARGRKSYIQGLLQLLYIQCIHTYEYLYVLPPLGRVFARCRGVAAKAAMRVQSGLPY